jgi:hypothetical protein
MLATVQSLSPMNTSWVMPSTTMLQQPKQSQPLGTPQVSAHWAGCIGSHVRSGS